MRWEGAGMGGGCDKGVRCLGGAAAREGAAPREVPPPPLALPRGAAGRRPLAWLPGGGPGGEGGAGLRGPLHPPPTNSRCSPATGTPGRAPGAQPRPPRTPLSSPPPPPSRPPPPSCPYPPKPPHALDLPPRPPPRPCPPRRRVRGCRGGGEPISRNGISGSRWEALPSPSTPHLPLPNPTNPITPPHHLPGALPLPSPGVCCGRLGTARHGSPRRAGAVSCTVGAGEATAACIQPAGCLLWGEEMSFARTQRHAPLSLYI